MTKLVPSPLRSGRAVAAEGRPTFETVILGGGPAGTGSLVWAAQNSQLGAWLNRGVAVVERSASGSSLGQYALNADSPGRSFLECLDGSECEPPLLEVRRDPVTREMEGWRTGHPPLELVDRFERRVHAAISAEIDRHPASRVYADSTARALYLQPDGSVVVVISTADGERETIHAASAVMALGGQPNTSWGAVEQATGADFERWRHKIISSHQLLKHGAAEQVGQLLVSKDRPVRAVIVGGSHSAFSSAWMLLDRMPDVRFDTRGVQILHRSEPRVTYYSRAEAEADSYRFAETDVCQATGRVHRLGGLQGDGRQMWRRIHGKDGMAPDNRAVLRPMADLPRAELVDLLEGADLIVSAFGYRLATVPVFDKDGYPLPLAKTGPSVGSDARLLDADGRAIPGLFGVGLGSGFTPWGGMSGEASFTGQQNSLWLYQHGLGELIHNGSHQHAQEWATAHARDEKGSRATVSTDGDDAVPMDEVRIR
ncbi:FAD-dependent oxidoreductase [Candidatus Mycobacterium wuenschmannii]|uniref:FAD-dependent oxidoreductase n=1 Tax=Candidatus Mycobacterium wuenschmannii TaxID=3027808 RepID=A0ABY8VW52_9MYCO|nr:FAD-dependent oxidoreductase [Candidatus Mycobacterium wuenschmannii]WIM85734.1 FAD-dependent oxidoreductase [Candidatus Mycobacterium wuenschmannii]